MARLTCRICGGSMFAEPGTFTCSSETHQGAAREFAAQREEAHGITSTADTLLRELLAERALADRLAEALRDTVPCMSGDETFWSENENTAAALAAYNAVRK